MSLDPDYQVAYEEQLEQALDEIYDFFNSKDTENLLYNHITDAIDHGLAVVELELPRSEIADEAEEIFLEVNGWVHKKKYDDAQLTISVLEENVFELQKQLQEAYIKIKNWDKWLANGGAG